MELLYVFGKQSQGQKKLHLGCCCCGQETVRNGRWQINLKRLDYLSTAEFDVKGVRGDEMK